MASGRVLYQSKQVPDHQPTSNGIITNNKSR